MSYPSQFASWLGLAERDGLGGPAAEPPAIIRGQARLMHLNLREDLEFGDWTDGAFSLLIYYDDEPLAGGSVTYQTTAVAADAYFSEDHPYRHHVGRIVTVDAGGAGGETGGASPPGGGGWDGTDPGFQNP